MEFQQGPRFRPMIIFLVSMIESSQFRGTLSTRYFSSQEWSCSRNSSLASLSGNKSPIEIWILSFWIKSKGFRLSKRESLMSSKDELTKGCWLRVRNRAMIRRKLHWIFQGRFSIRLPNSRIECGGSKMSFWR
jgi:hypothetical protein